MADALASALAHSWNPPPMSCRTRGVRALVRRRKPQRITALMTRSGTTCGCQLVGLAGARSAGGWRDRRDLPDPDRGRRDAPGQLEDHLALGAGRPDDARDPPPRPRRALRAGGAQPLASGARAAQIGRTRHGSAHQRGAEHLMTDHLHVIEPAQPLTRRRGASTWRRVRRPVRDVEVPAASQDGAHAADPLLLFAWTCPRCLDTVYSRFNASWRCPDCSRR